MFLTKLSTVPVDIIDVVACTALDLWICVGDLRALIQVDFSAVQQKKGISPKKEQDPNQAKKCTKLTRNGIASQLLGDFLFAVCCDGG